MIAVLAVIADHLFHWPSGGFVGVDVFFVLSGFLITGLLIREHDKTGSISFTSFYRRRVKRIMPAALLVVTATLVAAYFLFNKARFLHTVEDGVWAIFFGANWNFAFAGTDYFGATSAVSPLQHYWSLAVEEQFYFVWPWLMLLIYVLVARARGGRAHARAIVLGTILVLTAASFAWSLWESATNPAWAYFSTFARAWELGVGAVIAVLAPTLGRLPGWARTPLAWLGLIGIAVSVFIVSSEAGGFPAPWASLPVLATAAVVISGIGAPARFVWPISNPVSNYIGDISYSLYLWHWPIIVFTAVVLPREEPLYFVVVLALTLILSISSYHLVEDPVRRSSLFEPRTARRKRSRRGPRWLRALRESETLAGGLGLAAVAAIVVVLTVMSLQSVAPPPVTAGAGAAVRPSPTASVDSAASSADLTDTFRQQAQEALAAQSWPELSPSIDDVLASNPGEIESSCDGVNRPSVDQCSWGDPQAPIHLVLVGDSTSSAYLPTFASLVQLRPDVRITMWAMNGCRFSSNLYDNANKQIVSACADRIAAAQAFISEAAPTAVIVTNNYGGDLVSTGKSATDEEWLGGLESAVQPLVGKTPHVVFLASPPGGPDPAECYTPVSSPADCATEVSKTRQTRVSGESSLAAKIGGVSIDPADFLCDEGKCPEFLGTLPVRRDANHLSAAFASSLAPVVSEILVSSEVLPAPAS